jgi:hypothetical protein
MDDYIRKPYRPADIFECMARHLGIRYDTGEEIEESGTDHLAELKAEDLSALPDELRKELQDALIMLNPARLTTAIERICQENPALGWTLARYADRYAYSKIFDAMTTESEATALAMPRGLDVRP